MINRAFYYLELPKTFKVLPLFIMLLFLSSCGDPVENVEERLKQQAALVTAPAITSVSPEYAPIAGGDTLTVNGARLDKVNTVTVGGVSCSILSASSSKITCTLGSSTSGVKDVKVENSEGELGSLSAAFTYLDPPSVTSVSPSGGVLAGGDEVTVIGTGFFNVQDVTFDGTSCSDIEVVDDKNITCTTPTGSAGPVNVIVTNGDSQTATGSSVFTYKSKGTITNITSTTPGDGYYRNGDTVDIIVTFSENINSTSSSLTLDTGGTASYQSGTGSTALTYQYTIAYNDESTDLTVSSFNISDAVDDYGVVVDETLPGSANLSDNQAIVVDNTYPTVGSITASSPVAGTYADSTTFNIVVNYSEAVNTSSSTLTLNNGATASYFSGDGTSNITYQYTSASTEDTSALNVTTINPLGDIVDLAGNVIAQSIPTGSNLADDINYVIDTTAPSIVRVTSDTGQGYYMAGEVIDIDVEFSEVVYASTPELTLSSGATVNLTTGSGTNELKFQYTVGAGQNSSDLEVTGVTIGDVRDVVNNGSGSSIPGGFNLDDLEDIVVDTTAPTITNITTDSSDGTYGLNNSTFEIEVTFSEIVDADNMTLTMDSGGTASFSSGNGTNTLIFEYTVGSGEDSLDLNVDSVTSNGSTDQAGNALDTDLTATTNLADNKAIVIDTTGPTISSVTSSDTNATYKADDVLTITVNFSENIVTASSSLEFDTGGTASYLSGSGSSTILYEYTIANGEDSTLLNVTSFNVSNAADEVGNAVDPDLTAITGTNNLEDNKALVVDTTAPTIDTITSPTGDGVYIAGDVIDIEVTFSESVTTTNMELVLDNDAIASYSSGSPGTGVTFSYMVAADEDSGDLDVSSVNIGDATDSVGNALDTSLASTSNLATNQAIIIDTTAPTITNITASEADGIYTDSTTFNIIVTFSEDVTDATLSTLSMNTTGTATYLSGNGTDEVTYEFTPAASDNVDPLNVDTFNANGVLDLAGNALDTSLPAGSNLSDNRDIEIDTTAPTVLSITATSSNGSYVESDVITIEVQYSEAVNDGGSELNFNHGGTTTGIYQTDSGSDVLTYTYTVGAGEDAADLDVLSISAGNTDLAGNALDVDITGITSFAAAHAIVIDTTVPTISSITAQTADGTYGTDEQVDIQLVFSEVVSTTDSTLSLDNGATAVYIGGDGTDTIDYRYTISAGDTNTADLDVTGFNLVSGVLDDAGNSSSTTLPGSMAAVSAIAIDTTQPTITSITTATADGTYGPSDPAIDLVVNFDKNVTTTDMQINLTSGGTATLISGSGTSTLNFSYAIASGEESSDVTIDSIDAGDAVDDYNNPLDTTEPATTFGDDETIAIDGVGPQAQNIASSTSDADGKSAGEIVIIEVTYDENVTISSGDLTLDSGGTASYVGGNGTSTITYNYTVSPGEEAADLKVTSFDTTDGVDAYGNAIQNLVPASNNLDDNHNFVVDAVAPTMLGIDANQNDGTYGYQDVIEILVTFDEAVNSTTASLTLNNGAVVALSGGDGTTILQFDYTIGSSDDVTTLDVTTFTVGDTEDVNADNAFDGTITQNLSDSKSIEIEIISPSITAVSPQGGATSGGDQVTISGVNFFTGATVTIGGNTCTSPSVSSTEITCTTPNNTTDGYEDVVVENTDGLTSTLTNAFLFTPEITIDSISQDQGSVFGGETITITGSNFETGVPTPSVSIGSYACTNVSVASSSSLTCDTSSGSIGTYDVTITQYYQTEALAGAFEYFDGAALAFQVGGANPNDPADWTDAASNYTKTFVIENIGTETSSTITTSVSGANTAYFLVGTDTCDGTTLSAGATCEIQVTFNYTFATGGETYNATLEVTTPQGGNDSNDMVGDR